MPSSLDGTVRLVGGDSPLRGRLEVHYQGIWGTVCKDGWSLVNSDIVCQQLGFPSADPELSYYGDSAGGTAPIMLDEVRCTGKEARLVDCAHDGWAITDCSHDGDIGIVCSNTTTTLMPSTTLIVTTHKAPKTAARLPNGELRPVHYL